jgi:hypothetical protein
VAVRSAAKALGGGNIAWIVGAVVTVPRYLLVMNVAALGSHGRNDTAPSTAEGVEFPVHVLPVSAMGCISWIGCSSTPLPRSARN